jgi:hypothetical protein
MRRRGHAGDIDVVVRVVNDQPRKLRKRKSSKCGLASAPARVFRNSEIFLSQVPSFSLHEMSPVQAGMPNLTVGIAPKNATSLWGRVTAQSNGRF